MWSPSPEKIASSTSILSVAASLVASAFLFRSMANDLLPDGVYRCFQKLLNRLSPQLTVVVEEFDGIAANQMFESANTYLGSKLTYSVQKIKVHKPLKEANLIVSMDKNQEFYDSYEGVTFKWILISTSDDSPISNTGRRRDQSYILQEAKAIREEKKTLKLHTISYSGSDYWSSVNLNHPATLDSIAMELIVWAPRHRKVELDCGHGQSSQI